MLLKCKNCHHYTKGNYCNHCGQATKTSRLNVKHIVEDLENGLFSFNNGILYTLKQLFTNPGNSINAYINGQRVNHYQPISLLLLLAAVFLFLNSLLGLSLVDTTLLNSSTKDIHSLNKIITQYYTLLFFCFIPILVIFSYFIFKKQPYNFIEHFVFHTFLASQRLVVLIAFTPIHYLTQYYSNLNYTLFIIPVTSLVLFIWSHLQFFKNLPKIQTAIKAFLIFTMQYFCIVVFVFWFLFYSK